MEHNTENIRKVNQFPLRIALPFSVTDRRPTKVSKFIKTHL